MKRNDHKDAAKGLILSSPMQSLHYFNLVDGFPFDYMHATLMGVVKRVTELLFESTQDMPYTISGRGTLYFQLINSINRSIDRSINQSIHPSIIDQSPFSFIHEERDIADSRWNLVRVSSGTMELSDFVTQSLFCLAIEQVQTEGFGHYLPCRNSKHMSGKRGFSSGFQ